MFYILFAVVCHFYLFQVTLSCFLSLLLSFIIFFNVSL